MPRFNVLVRLEYADYIEVEAKDEDAAESIALSNAYADFHPVFYVDQVDELEDSVVCVYADEKGICESPRAQGEKLYCGMHSYIEASFG